MAMRYLSIMNKRGVEQFVEMTSYGIGTSMVMGVLVEKFNDDKGVVWPAQVAPFQVHGLVLNGDHKETAARSERVREQLEESGIELLWDDRQDVWAGEKLADADLIGIPWRAVVAKKTRDNIEIKERNKDESKLISLEELIAQVKDEDYR